MIVSPFDYERFCRILEQQSGILLGKDKQYLVVSRLSNFIIENQLASLGELTEKMTLLSGTHILQKVIDLMTTNETLWFRDSYPFEYMKNSLIPTLKKQRSIRVWSAACSYGQEPYSLAILLDEANTHAEIIATDLSMRVLERAKEGVYQNMELDRGLPNSKRLKYFSKVDETHWQLVPQLRQRVRFHPLNLLALPYNIGTFDVIFCRNVLIYFSQDNKTKVLNSLIEQLNPGGYLFLGASESLTSLCHPLELVRCNLGLVYKKSL